jgi:hypothetical protein
MNAVHCSETSVSLYHITMCTFHAQNYPPMFCSLTFSLGGCIIIIIIIMHLFIHILLCLSFTHSLAYSRSHLTTLSSIHSHWNLLSPTYFPSYSSLSLTRPPTHCFKLYPLTQRVTLPLSRLVTLPVKQLPSSRTVVLLKMLKATWKLCLIIEAPYQDWRIPELRHSSSLF